jgi:hypothetical protein
MLSRNVMVLLALLSLPITAMGGSGPQITFDKLTHDYGKVRYGETVTEEFMFTNTGDRTLVIEQLRASCGCTKAIKGSSQIAPGGKSKIVTEFDTSELKPGTKQKTIFVHSNDPEKPVVKLLLLADVVKDVNITPPNLAKRIPGFVETITFPLKISNTSDRVVGITGLKVQPGDVTASLQPQTVSVGPQGSATFDVNIRLEKDPGRSFYMGRLTISTDHPTEQKTDVSYLIQLEQPK